MTDAFVPQHYIPPGIPMITDCVLAELEKLGSKYRVALRVAKDPRIERLHCTHPGTYADDCIVDRVSQVANGARSNSALVLLEGCRRLRWHSCCTSLSGLAGWRMNSALESTLEVSLSLSACVWFGCFELWYCPPDSVLPVVGVACSRLWLRRPSAFALLPTTAQVLHCGDVR